MQSKALRWLLVVAWMVVIFCFSSQANSNEVTKAVFGDFNYWVRKASHVTEYAILFALARWATGADWRAFLIAVLYACSDEWHQSFVAGRTGTPTDVLIDSIGPTLLCARNLPKAFNMMNARARGK
jgi:VanZ family protein